MVVAKKKSQSVAAAKKRQHQQQQQEDENNNHNHNNDGSDEIQTREQLPVLPTRMEVRRARINEKKMKKAVKQSDAVTKKEYKQKGVVVRGGEENEIDQEAFKKNPFSYGTLLAAAAKTKKLKAHSKLIAKLNSAAAGLLKSKTETTANLSDKQREKIFVSEIQNIQKVQNNPVFQKDPLGSLQAHLQGTARMLQAPNPECRREPLDNGASQQNRWNGNNTNNNRSSSSSSWGNGNHGSSSNNNNNNNNNRSGFNKTIGNFGGNNGRR